jgi:hypothetical protein
MKNTPYFFEDSFYFDKGYVPTFRDIMQKELCKATDALRAEEYIKMILATKDKIEIKTLRDIIYLDRPDLKDIFEKYIVIS